VVSKKRLSTKLRNAVGKNHFVFNSSLNSVFFITNSNRRLWELDLNSLELVGSLFVPSEEAWVNTVFGLAQDGKSLILPCASNKYAHFVLNPDDPEDSIEQIRTTKVKNPRNHPFLLSPRLRNNSDGSVWSNTHLTKIGNWKPFGGTSITRFENLIANKLTPFDNIDQGRIVSLGEQQRQQNVTKG